MDSDLGQKLNVLERRFRNYRLLTWLLCGTVTALIVVLIAGRGGSNRTEQSLRLNELEIIDSTGTVRARIGGDLPDAIIDGKRVPRGQQAAGVLLYDGTGQERGGYVTWEPSGNVGLTLDSRQNQVALFVADPVAGAALQIWRHNDIIELRADDDGSRLTAVRDGKLSVQLPPIGEMGQDACTAFQEALNQYSFEDVWTACRKRFTDSVCAKCLGQNGDEGK